MGASTARDLRRGQLPPLAAARAASAPRFTDPGELALMQTGSYAELPRTARDLVRWLARELAAEGATHAGCVLAPRRQVRAALRCCVKSVNNARDAAVAAGFIYTKRTQQTERGRGARGDGPLAWYAGPMLLTAARMAAARNATGERTSAPFGFSRGVKNSPRTLQRDVRTTLSAKRTTETSKRPRSGMEDPGAALRRPGYQSPPPPTTAAPGDPVGRGRRRDDPRARALQGAVDAFGGRLPDVDRRALTKAAGLCPAELLDDFAPLAAQVAAHFEPDPERRTAASWVKLPGAVFRRRLANAIAQQLGAAAVPADWRSLLVSPARRLELAGGSPPPRKRAEKAQGPQRVAVSITPIPCAE